MRSLIVAAVVALTFASGAHAAQVDYFNKNTTPLAGNVHGIGPASMGGGSGTGKAGAGGGGGKISAHCAPGAKGKACHKA
jgi:hypothetical protein